MIDAAIREIELNHLRVRTTRQLIHWAIVAFDLPDQIAAASDSVSVVDVGSAIYTCVGQRGDSYRVARLNAWATAPSIAKIIEEWNYSFGVGLPHDYECCIAFKR